MKPTLAWFVAAETVVFLLSLAAIWTNEAMPAVAGRLFVSAFLVAIYFIAVALTCSESK